MIDVHEMVKQLTQTHAHRQPYTHETNGTTWAGHHTTTTPPLITQLANSHRTTDGRRGAMESKPAANLEALDTLVLIDNQAASWVRKLGEDDPGDTIACVRKVYALAASARFCGNKPTIENRRTVCCTVHQIERDIRTWWTQARLVTGWDTPAWRPNNTCPMCTERRTLRIRVDDRDAMCVSCRETWTAETVGLLAEHIRAENGDDLAS